MPTSRGNENPTHITIRIPVSPRTTGFGVDRGVVAKLCGLLDRACGENRMRPTYRFANLRNEDVLMHCNLWRNVLSHGSLCKPSPSGGGNICEKVTEKPPAALVTSYARLGA